VTLPPFEQVLAAHGAEVHRYLVAGVGPIEADDCFQEVMVAALRAYPALRDDNLRGWLFRVAYTKAIDAHRRRTRAAVPVDEPEPHLPAAPAPAEPDDAELWSAVRRLPPRQRAAVIHRFLHDLPYREIGAVIGCSEAAARQNVRAGLATLRQRVTAPDRVPGRPTTGEESA
jgi:RNA polymerase sigma factor (sigma-70 family)